MRQISYRQVARDMDADDDRTIKRFRLPFRRHAQDMVFKRISEHASCESNDQSSPCNRH